MNYLHRTDRQKRRKMSIGTSRSAAECIDGDSNRQDRVLFSELSRPIKVSIASSARLGAARNKFSVTTSSPTHTNSIPSVLHRNVPQLQQVLRCHNNSIRHDVTRRVIIHAVGIIGRQHWATVIAEF